jgi:F-type H+-transporting ATPase subunit gamma
MAGTKEIRVKIASVKSTQKITKAMQMVATSKMRRAQERMRLARPYAAKIRSVIGNLTQANPDYRHPYLQERAEVRNVGIIVVSPDRGLCGSLNVNNFKNVLVAMRDYQPKGVQVSLCLIGSKSTAFFRRLPNPILASTSGLGDYPHIKDLLGTIKVMLDAYKDGKIDRLYLASSRFVNTMTQKPEVIQLLPVEPIDGAELQEHWDYIYEPGAAEILDVRAARRWIERIEIMHCGADPEQPVFRGIMEVSKAESQTAFMRPTLFFRITRQGREGWRLTMDD